jgi:DNA polymerase-1
MRHHSFAAQTTYPVCLLVPSIQQDQILREYLDPFPISASEVMILDLHQKQGAKKTPVAEMKEYVESELVQTFEDLGVEYLIVADADYFKVLTKTTKADANVGYVLDCAFGPWKVVYVPNHKQVFYDPEKVRAKISAGMNALIEHRAGSYQHPGTDIIKFAAYPETDDEIEQWLIRLLEMDCPLTIDIEAFSLKHNTAGIGSISFAWNQHEGIAFAVDYAAHDPAYPRTSAADGTYGSQVHHPYRKKMLRAFFDKYLQRAIYHNIAFDVYVLIFELFMADILDTEGLLTGLNTMLRDWDCTKLITFLATNSCAGNKLKLKEQAQEFAGNWAVDDIKDIRKIPLPELLQYNLIDSLSTWYTHTKHHGTMIADQQEEIYETIFKPATVDIIQMQLTGMPINMQRVGEVRALLETDAQTALDKIQASLLVQSFTYHLQEEHVRKRNEKLKKKQITMSDDEVAEVEFNPNSGPQTQMLLYETLGLPVIAYTDAKQPSTDADTLKALRNHTQDPLVIGLLNGLLDYAAVGIILSTFIPAMENAALGKDGWHYLFGNFNLGGTLSGRLSSSKPNLQNIPAKSKYAKLIKSCFEAPPGWLFCGLDFNSLEDRISALTTKDPNKIKVYTDGYDGHCLRAFAYYGENMSDIDPASVASINSIAKLYEDERQESKVPTFALTYQGTFRTLMVKCGFDEAKARRIEAAYHELYEVSDKWIAAKLQEAGKTGYVTAAFGLRVRTPLLKQVVAGTRKTPYEATAEGRSAGNALGQSWCLLNSRAGSEFMGKVRVSEHRLNIRPTSQIHDAGYFLIRDDIEAIQYANEHLVKAVEWQAHPDISHPEVGLGGELSIFYPNWSKEITIPNGATESEIFAVIEKHLTG